MNWVVSKCWNQKPRERRAKKFNLNDDDDEADGDQAAPPTDELTHFGQSLSQIENFERDVTSDNDDFEDPNDVDKGRINGIAFRVLPLCLFVRHNVQIIVCVCACVWNCSQDCVWELLRRI